jgi:hypothetical protein
MIRDITCVDLRGQDLNPSPPGETSSLLQLLRVAVNDRTFRSLIDDLHRSLEH